MARDTGRTDMAGACMPEGPDRKTGVSDVIAVFGPTASGKSAVAEGLAARLGTEVVSADAMQAYRGLPILTNQPVRPTRLVGIWPLAHEGSVGEYQHLAHDAVDELVAASGCAVVAGGTGLYLRAALAVLDVPPAPFAGERKRWERAYDADPAAAYARLVARDPAAAGRVHPHDRRRVVRALELAEAGRSLVPGEERLWSAHTRLPTLIVGLDVPADDLERRIAQRTDEMFARGVVAEVRASARGPGFEDRREGTRSHARSPRCRPNRRATASSFGRASTLRTSGNGCGEYRGSSVSTRHAPSRRSSMQFSKWHALGNSYLIVESADSGVLTADRARRLCDVERGIGADGVLEITATGAASADLVIWNPDGSTAEMSGNGTRIAARWLADRSGAADVVVRVGSREVRAHMIDDIDVETDVGPVDVGVLETIDVHGNAVELTTVSVGNPHAVVRCEEPARDVLLRLGPLIETHPRFPRAHQRPACAPREPARDPGAGVGAGSR